MRRVSLISTSIGVVALLLSLAPVAGADFQTSTDFYKCVVPAPAVINGTFEQCLAPAPDGLGPQADYVATADSSSGRLEVAATATGGNQALAAKASAGAEAQASQNLAAAVYYRSIDVTVHYTLQSPSVSDSVDAPASLPPDAADTMGEILTDTANLKCAGSGYPVGSSETFGTTKTGGSYTFTFNIHCADFSPFSTDPTGIGPGEVYAAMAMNASAFSANGSEQNAGRVGYLNSVTFDVHPN